MSFIQYLRQHAPLKALAWCSGLLMVILSVTMTALMHGLELPAIQVAMDKAVLLDLFEQATAEQRLGYVQHFHFDMVFPLAYGTFFTVIMAMLFNRRKVALKFERVLYLPGIAVVFDLIENGLAAPYALDVSQMPEMLVFLMSVAAMIKWVCLMVVAVMLIGLLLAKKVD